MSYFAPYIDGSGLHLPTYEDRLENLCEGYRSIFGLDAVLSASVPDYQLLSLFAKALDDVSALVLQAFLSRNPAYASGQALDLLLPQYGLTRGAEETDAEVRGRIASALAGKGAATPDALRAGLLSLPYVRDARVFVNDTDAPDADGIPAHSLAPVVYGGVNGDIAGLLFRKKAPGVGTYGSVTVPVTDAYGNVCPVSFTRAASRPVFLYLYVKRLEGCDDAAVEATVAPAVAAFVNGLGIAAPLNVPQLYGVAYAAAGALASSFAIHDIQAAPTGGETSRVRVDAAWNQRLSTPASGGVSFTFSDFT